MMKRRSLILIGVLAMTAALWTPLRAADDSALTPKEQLGKELFFDKISVPASMSCAECHAPSVGFTGPIPGINLLTAVYPGAVPTRYGNRKPPAAAYATFSPIFYYDEDEGLFIGGNFWDGRATGERLGNPAADQALGPFLNPVEQNNPSKQAVLEVVADSKYADLWEEVWGEPVQYETMEQIEQNYDRIGLAIAAYEASSEVNQFSSKFDLFWHNLNADGLDVTEINMMNWSYYMNYGLTENETKGLALFNDENKGKCALCHVLEGVDGNPPLFTDFSFDNLGTPKNPDNPFYEMDEVYLDDGSPINPEGADWIDPGLGGFLATRPEYASMAAGNYGKHKVPTLRNVAKGPGIVYPKAYMHNGVFKTLLEVVHFYNTRDVLDWPPPEVADNVNTDELGDLGLTPMEEQLIVDFMKTLSDGYRPKDKLFAQVEPVSMEVSIMNPFNPTTMIRFSLPAAGNVSIHAYNVAGQRVATIYEGYRDAGEHEIAFHAEGIASGVYFVRLAYGDQVRTAKAVILR
jgi:cytochrome c peroxidase